MMEVSKKAMIFRVSL